MQAILRDYVVQYCEIFPTGVLNVVCGKVTPKIQNRVLMMLSPVGIGSGKEGCARALHDKREEDQLEPNAQLRTAPQTRVRCDLALHSCIDWL